MKHLEHVQVCEKCNGSGKSDSSEWKTHGLQHHSSTVCPICKGSGMVLKTVVIDIEPYRQGDEIENKMFSKLKDYGCAKIMANDLVSVLHQKPEKRGKLE